MNTPIRVYSRKTSRERDRSKRLGWSSLWTICATIYACMHASKCLFY